MERIQTGQNEPIFPQGQLNNQGGAIETHRLKLNADSLNNQAGRLVALSKSQQDWQDKNILIINKVKSGQMAI